MVLLVFIVSFFSELIAEFDRLVNLKCHVCLHLCTCLLNLAGASGGDIGFPLTR